MIRVVTPLDIIYNELSSNDETLKLINDVSSFLEKQNEYPIYDFKLKVICDKRLSARQVNLVKNYFVNFGWKFSIERSDNEESKVVYYISIAVNNKIYV